MENREERLGLIDQHVMARIRNLDEASLWNLTCQISRRRSGEQSALRPANQKCGAADLGGVGSRSTRDSKPSRIEFVSETPVLVLLNRMRCDVET